MEVVLVAEMRIIFYLERNNINKLGGGNYPAATTKKEMVNMIIQIVQN